jgi:hypothetical protein
VWRTASPGPNDVPLLVGGQSATNGVDGAFWEIDYPDAVYLEAVGGGTAELTYAFLGTGAASRVVSRASLKMAASSINIDGDYNRDGTPKDHPLEANAVTFAGPNGYVIIANHDDDNGDGVSDGEKNPASDPLPNAYTINGSEDIRDIYELHVEKLGISASSIPSTWSLEIKVLDTETEASTQAAIIYPNRNAGTQGGTTLNFSSTSIGSIFGGTGDATVLGIEGRGYGEEVIVRMTLKDGTESVCSDEVRVLVAPFIVLSNVDKATKVFTGSGSGGSQWSVFHSDISTALYGMLAVESYGPPAFIQDYGEIGCTRSAPGMAVDKRTVIAGLGGGWFTDKIATDTAYFFLGGGDGGSIEASPQISGFPYGRVIVGDSLGAGTTTFLKNQKVQADGASLIELPVDWLLTEHADEVFTIIPAESGFKVLVADLNLAINLLRNNPTEETFGGFDTRATILARYDDPANANRLTTINNKLARVRSALSSGLGIAEVQFIKMPVAFSIDTPSRYYLPNMVNMLVVKTAGARKLVIPKPFFDPFEVDLDTKLTAAGYGAGEMETVDTRESHVGSNGEAHCATNPCREAP